MEQSLPELIEVAWAHVPPGRESAARNELLRALREWARARRARGGVIIYPAGPRARMYRRGSGRTGW
jgi:hypothetical protein